MDRIIYHVSHRPKESCWEVRRENRSRANFLAPTQDAAVERIVRSIGDKKAQVVIHGQDGAIQEERTYPRSSDPPEREG